MNTQRFRTNESTHTFQTRASLVLKRWSFKTLVRHAGAHIWRGASPRRDRSNSLSRIEYWTSGGAGRRTKEVKRIQSIPQAVRGTANP